jgi:hypothetical protein
MSREFTLVLLGAGVLTAGSFLWPGDDVESVANEHAGRQVASANATGTSGSRGYRAPVFIWLHTSSSRIGATSGARPPVARGGFGGIGRSVSGVS